MNRQEIIQRIQENATVLGRLSGFIKNSGHYNNFQDEIRAMRYWEIRKEQDELLEKLRNEQE